MYLPDYVKCRYGSADRLLPLGCDTPPRVQSPACLTSPRHSTYSSRNGTVFLLNSKALATLSQHSGDQAGPARLCLLPGRARIAAAQHARWAKAKGQKVVSICRPQTSQVVIRGSGQHPSSAEIPLGEPDKRAEEALKDRT